MKHQEKKYRIDGFDRIMEKLEKLGCRHARHSVSTHYYAKRADDGVTKMVDKSGHYEIHVLEEYSGKFTLRQNIAVADKQAGLDWLKESGFTDFTLVKMDKGGYE